MAFKFTEKRNTTAEETAYIVYMMVGSFFNKATCKNKNMANRLYLYYAEMKPDAQEKEEKKILSQAEMTLKGKEKIFSEMNCEVRIRLVHAAYLLDFITGFEQIQVKVKIPENGSGKRRAVCEMRILSNA